MKCSKCEFAKEEAAAKKMRFLRCFHLGEMCGRVVLNYPQDMKASVYDTGAPKWCPRKGD